MSASKAAAAKANTDKPTDVELRHELVREYLKDKEDVHERKPDHLDLQHISYETSTAVDLDEKQVEN